MEPLVYPEDIDRGLNWPLGKATRLARRGKLPHVVLPDKSLRFEWARITALLKRVPEIADGDEPPESGGESHE